MPEHASLAVNTPREAVSGAAAASRCRAKVQLAGGEST